MTNEPIGLAQLGEVIEGDMWAPDDHDLIIIIDGTVIE